VHYQIAILGIATVEDIRNFTPVGICIGDKAAMMIQSANGFTLLGSKVVSVNIRLFRRLMACVRHVIESFETPLSPFYFAKFGGAQVVNKTIPWYSVECITHYISKLSKAESCVCRRSREPYDNYGEWW
jgi:hypothetical protein